MFKTLASTDSHDFAKKKELFPVRLGREYEDLEKTHENNGPIDSHLISVIQSNI
jgi:hypothetical protein